MPTTVVAGTDVVLVTAVQARNNARLVFFGSLWMLSNEAFEFVAANGVAANNEVRVFERVCAPLHVYPDLCVCACSTSLCPLLSGLCKSPA